MNKPGFPHIALENPSSNKIYHYFSTPKSETYYQNTECWYYRICQICHEGACHVSCFLLVVLLWQCRFCLSGTQSIDTCSFNAYLAMSIFSTIVFRDILSRQIIQKQFTIIVPRTCGGTPTHYPIFSGCTPGRIYNIRMLGTSNVDP
jgi:hypothetical protein